MALRPELLRGGGGLEIGLGGLGRGAGGAGLDAAAGDTGADD